MHTDILVHRFIQIEHTRGHTHLCNAYLLHKRVINIIFKLKKGHIHKYILYNIHYNIHTICI